MSPTRHLWVAIIGTTIHLVSVAGLFVMYLTYIPRMKKFFDEFGLTLSWLTLNVIRISIWVCEYWWALMPIALLALIAQYAVLAYADRHSKRIVLKILWVVGIAAMLLAVAIVSFLSIQQTMIKLQEGLSR